MTETLSWAQARRIALRSQGIGPARRTVVPGPAASRRALDRTLERTHLLQIDSVNVFARAHHMPVFTRTGSWDTTVLETASRPGPGRRVREALAHEAAYATPAVHALLAFRRARAAHRDWGAVRRAAEQSPHLFEGILRTIAEHGPLSAAAISRHLGDHDRGEGWGWRRTESQWAVEYLFRSGALDCVGRNERFERLYLPAPEAPDGPVDPGTDAAEDPAAVLSLTSLAARALGIADAGAIADYFRLRVGEVRPAITRLLADGELREVEVGLPEGPRRLLLHRDAPQGSALRGAALVSPFDPIAFHRPRLRELFDVDYTIGIYTPAQRRTTGYYSLLLLLGDRIPARVDLRSDRSRGVLEVRGTYAEPALRTRARERPGAGTIAGALAAELSRAATWQGLEEIEVLTGPGTGDLSAALHAEVRAASAAGIPS
ncbi:hypothetical protein BF93_01625 [Brachybacterium phenoliresistens]|uniref:Winged helix-turn-helix domain-containing protein n=1 Tax=Brachybacterium phenoliresistens TaxID=396014 RepID=Z9JSM1_9MICO|nr:crosslink repair DNA glycosylase YcaQ family protein [Brachybacterium phenoliresistens]EWS80806.1 hypothetical protein BF93_01625 [Brachybacterium phenoliresistens]